MRIHFKALSYQLDAVQAVVDCFKGQPLQQGVQYKIDPGRINAKIKAEPTKPQTDMFEQAMGLQGGKVSKKLDHVGFENAPIFDLNAVLKNIQDIQSRQNIEKSYQLETADYKKGKTEKNLTGSELNIDIEMETGTGKTYCYIRTMFELNKKYGWSKFIVVVPSIAIREGVYKSLNMMAEHFQEQYGKKARFFIYDSKALHHLESFSSNGGINVMIINVQAFNATGKDNLRIYNELDEFQSRKPIEVINRNRPILILDEPQKMQAEKTLSSLANFKPLFILRYSATHKKNYNLVYRLDALDAYNQKLVKKISVHGIQVQGLSGTNGYMYLQDIILSKSAPVARLEIEVKQNSGFKRSIRKIEKGTNLYDLSNGSEQYKDRFVVTEIDDRDKSVSFVNGTKIYVGQCYNDASEKTMRTLQIRETIIAHLQKEKQLFSQGIKVLSLFFIDEVAKYRQYDGEGNAVDGEYVQIFKEQYKDVLNEYIDLNLDNDPYVEYLKGIQADATHNGYFSIDKKSKRLTDPSIDKKAEETQISNDLDAYDLILKDKERLLSFEEPTRFIFSHSALREGWDNPNVFVICTLKHSDNVISRRQEVGRGLRLAVNKQGERMDVNYFNGAMGEIHKINELTVVTNESYKDFVKNLQSEMLDAVGSRPTQATPEYFVGKRVKLEDGSTFEVDMTTAKQIHKYLTKNDYIDDNDHIADAYREAKANQTLAPLPESLQAIAEPVFTLVDSIFDPKTYENMVSDGKKDLKNHINPKNLERKEFRDLWNKINRKAVYQIQIDSEQLIHASIRAVDEVSVQRNNNFVEKLSYTLVHASMHDQISYDQLENQDSFGKAESKTEFAPVSVHSQVKYDLIGEIAEGTNLTRRTVVRILQGINDAVFAQYKLNPEAFIREMCRIINEQQAQMVIQGLKYNPLNVGYPDNEIFVSNIPIPKDAYKADHHVWEYVVTDSQVERNFVEELDGAEEVIVYAKLPDRFQIPTPFGNYNPDWAITFDKNKEKNIFFIAETKGSTSELQLKGRENGVIDSAKLFFEALNAQNAEQGEAVRYSVISSLAELKQLLQ